MRYEIIPEAVLKRASYKIVFICPKELIAIVTICHPDDRKFQCFSKDYDQDYYQNQNPKSN